MPFYNASIEMGIYGSLKTYNAFILFSSKRVEGREKCLSTIWMDLILRQNNMN